MMIADYKERPHAKIPGWLIPLGIALVLSPIKVGITLARDLGPFFMTDTWRVLTTPGTDVYHPLWAPLLVYEVVGNIGTIVICLITLWFFFHKSRVAPRFIIAFLAINLVLVGGDYFLSD